MAAGFDQTDLPVPWLGNRRLRLVFGKPSGPRFSYRIGYLGHPAREC
jgi:hypothetical protein